MFRPVIILSSLIILLTACNQNQSDTRTGMAPEKIMMADSCGIALTADNDVKENAQITRYQNAVNQNIQPIANLEKLGWAFVSQARSTFDKGYYNPCPGNFKMYSAKRLISFRGFNASSPYRPSIP